MSDSLKKHTLLLRDGDFDFLADVYAKRNVTASEVIRKVISDFVDKLKKYENAEPISNIGDFDG